MTSYVVNIDVLFDALTQNNTQKAKSIVQEAEKDVQQLENMIKQFATSGKEAVPILREIINLVKAGQYEDAKEKLKSEEIMKGYYNHLQGYFKINKFKPYSREGNQEDEQCPDSDDRNKEINRQGEATKKKTDNLQDQTVKHQVGQGNQSSYKGSQYDGHENNNSNLSYHSTNQENQSAKKSHQSPNKGGLFKTKDSQPVNQGNHFSEQENLFPNQGNPSTYPNFRNFSNVDRSEADSMERENQVRQAMSRNNPDIADLSDMNRPTKLAERFSELYDNEWTEAFDSLNTLKRVTEMKVIEELLFIVQDAYHFCKTEANNQIKAMCLECLKVIGGKDVSTETKQTETEKSLMMEFRKANAVLALPHLENNFFDKHIRNRRGIPPVSKNDPLAKYAKKAIEITWLMNVQVPPVYMCPTDEPFDSNLYRAYTKSGKVPDFFVWPALRLFKEGGVLVKGVVQFK